MWFLRQKISTKAKNPKLFPPSCRVGPQNRHQKINDRFFNIFLIFFLRIPFFCRLFRPFVEKFREKYFQKVVPGMAFNKKDIYNPKTTFIDKYFYIFICRKRLATFFAKTKCFSKNPDFSINFWKISSRAEKLKLCRGTFL